MSWTIAHSARGHLRARAPAPWLRRRLPAVETRLRAVHGVRAVSGNGLTGSVRIDYDARAVTPETLERALHGLARDLGGISAPRAPAAPTGAAALSLLGAGSAVAAAVLPVAAPVRAALLVGAGLPSLLRAGRALVVERRLGGEALEGVTLALLALRGQYAAAALLAFFRALGDVVLARALHRARRSLRDLVLPVRPVQRHAAAGVRESVDSTELRTGDLIGVTAGEEIPADGTVVSGEALVDQQTMTGESLPVERREGHAVFAGTTVEDGDITVRVERVGRDTALGAIVEALETATGEKSALQDFAESLADRQAARTLVLAGLGAAVSRSVNAGVAILVADYGMAARVGIPTALVTALTRASRAGTLIKGARVLESLARVDTVVCDKTGTLTSGTPRVARVVTFHPRWNEAAVIGLAAAAERGFRHPIARAVARLAEQRGVVVPKRSPTALVGGLGVDVRIDGARVLVGNHRFIESRGVRLAAAAAEEAAVHAAGGSATFLAVDGTLAGLLMLQDELRPDAAALLTDLRARGLRRVVLVTGDHAEPTRSVAAALGLREFHSDLMPEDKARLIRRLRAEGRVVAMVGDGINDALALNDADVGIAVRGGPEVVAEAADVVLVRGGLEGVVRAMDLARAAVASVRATVRTAARANLAVVGLASLGFAQPVASILLSRGSTLLSAASRR